MRKMLHYNFSSFLKIFDNMKDGKVNLSHLRQLKIELNKFFDDSTCKEIFYTENDKLFFGMRVMPVVSGDAAVTILQSDEPFRIDHYYVELDSKLFDPSLDLNSRELLAILLHEVGHIVNDTLPIEEARKYVDLYLANNNETLTITDSIHYREILAYGIRDLLVKITSIFEIGDDEVIADEFVLACGFGDDLVSAMKKIYKSGFKINTKCENKIVVLSWVLRLYKNVKLRRIPAIRTLQKAKSLTSSEYEKNEIDSVIKRLNRIDDEALIESYILEGKDSIKFKMKAYKYNSVKKIADDIYEINMRIRNTDNQDEALQLMRQINNSLSIIENFLETEEDLSEQKRKYLFNAQEELLKMRNDLAKKVTYKDKYFGIYVNYPEINTKY